MTNPDKMQFQARIDDLRGRLKEAWGDLTDDDVNRAEGRWDQLIATIREKTGESIESISSAIDGLIDSVQELGDSSDET